MIDFFATNDYVAKSKSTSWGVARWSIWTTDHITGSDRHDRYADQC